MNEDSQYVYILDSYNKFESDDVVEVFTINSRWYAIKRVKLYFGRPILSNVEKNEDESIHFHIYESLDDAKAYVRKLKMLEGAHV